MNLSHLAEELQKLVGRFKLYPEQAVSGAVQTKTAEPGSADSAGDKNSDTRSIS
ncbi:hypothetical protein D3C75_1066840 [compost metagenome]